MSSELLSWQAWLSSHPVAPFYWKLHNTEHPLAAWKQPFIVARVEEMDDACDGI